MISNLRVTPTNVEGELKLTWTKSSGVIGIKIMMSGSRYSISHTDGEEIYNGIGEEYLVQNLTPQKFYYFTLWYRTSSTWITGNKCKITGLTVKSKEFSSYTGFGEFLYRKLPELYRYMDRFQNTPDTLPLKRFLSLFGDQIDFIYSRISAIKEVVTDIDRTSDTYLDYMSKFLGWKPNKEIPIDRQRMELKGVYEFYKNKGTLLGVKNFAVAISGLYVKVKEFRKLCFKTNTANHRTLNTTQSMVDYYNSIVRTYTNSFPVICNVGRNGEWYNYRLNSVGIFLYGNVTDLSPSGLTKTQIENKINKILPTLLPAYVDGYIIWENLVSLEEEIKVSDYYKTAFDGIDWLKSNTMGRTTNTVGVYTPSSSTEYWEE